MSPQASAELVAAIGAANGEPVRVTDPDSSRVYVMQCVEIQSKEPEPPSEPEEVPPGIRAAQKAFWEALPDMLKNRKLRGKWAVFSPEGLIRASHDAGVVCKLRDADRENRYVDRIEPMDQPPWEPEEVYFSDWGGLEFEDDADER